MSSSFDSLNLINKSDDSKAMFDAPVDSPSLFDKNRFLNKKTERQPICVLCGCNSSQLGQGDFIKFNTANLNKTAIQQIHQLLNDKEAEDSKNANKNQRSLKFSKFRESVFNKYQKFGIADTILNDLIKIGWTSSPEHKQLDTKQAEIDNDDLWIHSNCSLWSAEMINAPSYSNLVCLEKKCSFCNMFGASVKCSAPACSEVFHYPCVSAVGCFQELKNKQILCPYHISNAVASFGPAANCCLCQSPERANEQLFCNSCGLHYHLGCLSSNIQMSALVRSGWQCPDCKTCQICKLSDDENKMFICGNCDKCYHSFCSKSDFQSSRCEKCTKLCYLCNNQFARDNETICNDCFDSKKNTKRSVRELLLASNSSSDLDLKNFETFNFASDENTKINKPAITTKKKQISKKNSRNSIRRQNSASSQVNTLRRSSKSNGKEVKGDMLKRNSDIFDENDSRNKDIDEPTIGHIKRDEDDHHAVTVISSLEDSFTLKQDMCLSCGSFGKPDEGVIISCSQCGQCFHNYCAGVTKICNVALEKGWRCLDCTVCEGCGKATDEGRLLLCDDCDISYHIYCLDPPLDQVPKGNWKCKWCVRCLKCGTKTPGKKSNWKNNYTECGLCNSLSVCAVCNFEYKEQDVLVKCFNCSRWSHCNCKTQISLEEAKNEINSQHYCPECHEERTEYNSKINSKKENQLNSKKFLEEIANLSKRGLLDEGTFLTDLGYELIKKIKIKPAPCTRRNRAPKVSTNVESESKAEKINDEGSRSSSEEKCDGTNENIGEKGTNNMEIKKQISTTKRQINFGLGGFNPKARSRNKNNPDDLNMENENKTVKRKKKSAFEEMIPVYMQEAFFGANMLASKENDFLEDDKIKYEKHTNKDSHKISLDENMLKLVQQNKKGHLELGIEDFLDGDIVSYLFNENKNLMEFNADHDIHSRHRTKDHYDEKIFDEKIYEDIFHQIVSDPPKVSNNVDEYLNLPGSHGQEQVNYETNISSRSNHQPDGSLFPHSNNLISQENNLKSTSDTKNIDDLARQFKESTHKYVQYNQIKSNDQNEQNNQVNAYNMNNNYLCNMQFINDKAQSMPNELDASQAKANLNNQNLINSQELVNNANNMNNMMYQPLLMDSANNRKMPTLVNNNIDKNTAPFINELSDAANDPSEFLSFEDHEASNDAPAVSKTGANNNNSKEDAARNQKKNLEKYAEDEALGDMATQAMPLYSNLNFPNLKNEMKDVGERFKYITKIWRKLDAQVKQVYINKSRNNRYKKKSDEKTVGKISNMNKRAKSPTNSDRHSDMDNFSRSATPSMNLDDTNDNSQHTHQLNLIKNVQMQYNEPPTPAPQQNLIKPQPSLETNKVENKNENPMVANKLTINQIQSMYERKEENNMPIYKPFEVESLLRNPNEIANNFQINHAQNSDRPLNIQQTALNNQNINSKQNIDEKSNFTIYPNIITLQQNNQHHGFPTNVIINPISHTLQTFPNQMSTEPNKNTIKETLARNVSNDSEISNHIDSVINDVVAGFGTIPYSSDFEEESNSSFREFLNNQEKALFNDESQDTNFYDKSSNDKNSKTKKKPTKMNKEDENGKKEPGADQDESKKQPKKRKQKMTIEALVNQQANEQEPYPKLIITESNKTINEAINFNYQPTLDDSKKYISQYQPINQTIISQSNRETMSFINIPSEMSNPVDKSNLTFICKDDNLKKMLSFSENNTILRLNILSKPAELGNTMLNEIKSNTEVNTQNIASSFSITNLNPNENPNQMLSNKFLQLDGAFDDIDQPSQAENGTAMITEDKLQQQPTANLALSVNKIQNSENIQGHTINEILANNGKIENYEMKTLKPTNGQFETANFVQKYPTANDYNSSKQNLIPVENSNFINESYLSAQHNKDIKPNFSIENITNSAKTPPIQAQKFTGENTLLKALLQTAPKNAVNSSNNDTNQNFTEPTKPADVPNPIAANIIQTNNAIITQITKTNNGSEMVQQAAPLTPINNAPLIEETKIVFKIEETNNQPIAVAAAAVNAKKANTQRKSKTIQNKLMIDLKNKILDSGHGQAETIKEMIKSEREMGEDAKNNSRKKKTVKMNAQKETSSEFMIGKVVNDINALEHLVMNQSYPDSSIIQINYPEKNHSTLIKSAMLTYGDLFKLKYINLAVNFLKEKNMIGKLLDKNEEFLSNICKKNSALHTNKDSKAGLNVNKQNLSEFCSALVEKPLTSSSIKNRPMLKDSAQRLNDVLMHSSSNTDSFSEDSKGSSADRTDAEKQNFKEYLKKNLTDADDYSSAFSPIIPIEIDHINTNAINGEQHNVEMTSSQENNKLIINNSQPPAIKNVKPESNLRLVHDTPTTLQNLTNLHPMRTCKFCDSFIFDADFKLEHAESSSTELKENNAQAIVFCSEFCKSSFKKLAILRKKETALEPPKPPVVSLDDSFNQDKKTKKVNEIFKELEEKTIIRWSMDLFNSTKMNEDEDLPKSSNTFEILKSSNYIDKRVCIFCQTAGDQEANGPSRLLVLDLDKWCHLNCALWSDEVYETMNGALINVDVAFKKSLNVECCFCHHKGATLKCFTGKCNTNYHLPCAIKDKCVFNHDKTFFCPLHANKSPVENKLNDLSVSRNVWIQRDEVAQIQSFMSSDFDESYYAIRIGSLILHNIGQLLPHQLNSGNFHNRNYIYPIGYRATRFYWSPNKCFKRCRYVCSIHENDSLPEFSITVIEEGFEKETLTDKSPTALWQRILERIEKLRIDNDLVKLFPVYFSGEYLFGLTEPHIIRLIESLPGVETLTNYVFKYGRLQLLDMPLTINPTGCARSEPKLRTHFRKSHTLTCNTNQRSTSSGGGTANATSSSSHANSDSNQGNFTTYYGDDDDNEEQEDEYSNLRSSDENQLISYSKQFVFSKSTQFKKLKADWRSNVYLKKSAIQGLGLYAAKDLEKNTMIIEYIGDLIRNEVANRREKLYEAQNRGIYMFRLNDDFVVDATITGGLARYVNHSCEPNCIAETVSLEKDEKIVIIANKRILKGEELTYDYKFDFEDDGNKISCLCGAANCKKWMN